jgi:outer membrane protein OmpA-like peptidoglycan-associated protein
MDLMRYQSEAEKKWISYEMDLVNAEVAIKALEKQAAEREAEIAQEIAIETATNTLIAQAETITLETPKIKREVKIIVVESEAWAKAVIVNFIRVFPVDKLRVKSWSKLTLAQMAEALAKSGAELHNLQTEEICK